MMKNRKSCQPNIVIKLPNDIRDSISEKLYNLPASYDQERDPASLAIAAASRIADLLDPCTQSQILDFREKRQSPYLLLRNFISTENIPPTPTNDTSPDTDSWRVQAAALLGLLHLSGYVAASFQDEMGGRLCHMVMPAKNDEKSFLRSTKMLNFHTEVVNGYFGEDFPECGQTVSPEAFGLICLRNPNGTPTTVLPLAKVLEKLDEETMTLLMKKKYTACSQSSFDRNIIIRNISVLNELSNGTLGIRYSHSKLKGQDESAQLALNKVHALLTDNPETINVNLNPGDALILNNRSCLHGRSAITDSATFDGLDRWLIRIYGFDRGAFSRMKKMESMKHVILLNE
ncbi:TauD/TfdA family dioxygenase [Edaphovirga cremea]|uniref:TauD/TfdA family dioxygenase n=1 Tax=Edaphovirga cremea TaxID=2267246 RepID=UPI000DF01D20|nr:TauD/TfdA family dioxygenase [Edaphovirga cremea]